MRRLGSPFLWDCDQITGETRRFFVRVTSRNVMVQSEHILHKVGTLHCGTCCLLHNTRTWPFQPRFQRHPKRRLVCETVRDVMAATHWAVAVVKRDLLHVNSNHIRGSCGRWPGSRCLNGSFQSVSECISLQLKEKLKREVWDSLETDNEPVSAANGNKVTTKYTDTQSPSPKTDIRKILLLLMLRLVLWSCGDDQTW